MSNLNSEHPYFDASCHALMNYVLILISILIPKENTMYRHDADLMLAHRLCSEIYLRRQNLRSQILTSKVDPRTERAKYL